MTTISHSTPEHYSHSGTGTTHSGAENSGNNSVNQNNVLFPCDTPVEPSMRNEAVRLNTFATWPFRHTVVPPRQIAQSGLYYLDSGDQTKCFYCGGGLQDWSRDDDPWVEHAKWFPECEFLLHERGPAWVSSITSRFPNIQRPNMTEVRRRAEQSTQNTQQQPTRTSSMPMEWNTNTQSNLPPRQTASVISQPTTLPPFVISQPEPPRIPSFQPARPRSPNMRSFIPTRPISPEPPRRPRSPISPRVRRPQRPESPQLPRMPRMPESPRSPTLPEDFTPTNIFTFRGPDGGPMNLGPGGGGTSITVEGSTLRIIGGQNVSIIRRGNETTVTGVSGGSSRQYNENLPEIRTQLSEMGYTRQEIDDAIDTYRNRSGSGEVTVEAVLDELNMVVGEPQRYQPPPPAPTSTAGGSGKEGETTTESQTGQQQQSSATTSGPCVVCLENMKEMVMVPCGHFCACRSCVRHLSRCPVCRTHIERTVRFFEA